MSKIYYGDGLCSINPEGSKIKLVSIDYKGTIKINDLTSDSFFINATKDKILIIPLGKGYLTDLFKYEGEFIIKHVFCLDSNGNKIKTSKIKNVDYANFIETNAEDLNLKPEELNKSFKSIDITCQTTLDKLTINNLHTSKFNYNLYYKNGQIYKGHIHIHIKNNKIMTGKNHTNESKNLYK
ncbi:MAG: hypothetical protein Unbinned4234contig1003_33 [Prokaryotic dsDNA virus sp.]|nr:MAG: hypothetical protein Unbinned4234contig1003_33 [Prokaryotic dsDNA virus sp.]|tara:strand:+ start:8229 stop:8774 length:546 start_codon:yes stop_codon:yes gene_type:complete